MTNTNKFQYLYNRNDCLYVGECLGPVGISLLLAGPLRMVDNSEVYFNQSIKQYSKYCGYGNPNPKIRQYFWTQILWQT